MNSYFFNYFYKSAGLPAWKVYTISLKPPIFQLDQTGRPVKIFLPVETKMLLPKELSGVSSEVMSVLNT